MSEFIPEGQFDPMAGVPAEQLQQFNLYMGDAQMLHGKGQFEDAVEIWQQAAAVLPDDHHFGRGRALRGAAASLDRLGLHGAAEIQGRVAMNLHMALFKRDSDENQPLLLRERSESRAVLGRITLGEVIRKERSGQFDPFYAREKVQADTGALELLRAALKDILKAESATGEIDQHKINLLPRLAIAETLYGDLTRGTEYAKQSVELAQLSEAKHIPGVEIVGESPAKTEAGIKNNPTQAGLGEKNAVRARIRAIARGYGALTVNRLIRNSVMSFRGTALRVASSKAGL